MNDKIDRVNWRSLVLILILTSAWPGNSLAQAPTEDDRLTVARTYKPPQVMSFLSLDPLQCVTPFAKNFSWKIQDKPSSPGGSGTKTDTLKNQVGPEAVSA